jgi:hypothetical protein
MISVQELVKLGKEDPKAAHRLVANAIGERGHQAFYRFRGRQECIRRALQKPLPGAAGDAFTVGTMHVNGKAIYEVRPTHIRILQALDSPLLKMAKEAEESKDKKAAADFTESQQWEICFLFTERPKSLRILFDEQGIAGFRRAAGEAWEEKSAAEINMTVTAAIVQYARHIRTTVEFAQEMEASGDKSFFQEIAEKVSKPAASAGS